MCVGVLIRLISLGQNKPFQTLKHHNLLSAAEAKICASQFKDPNSYEYGGGGEGSDKCRSKQAIQTLNIIIYYLQQRLDMCQSVQRFQLLCI